MPVKVVGLNCSLKGGSTPSNTQVLMDEVVEQMRLHDEVEYDVIRVADHDVKPGVEADMGDGDEWPAIAARVLDAEVLLFGTPIWVGHPSSVAQRAMERMDSWLFSYNELGQKKPYGRVAAIVVTGNEDGGHLVHAQCAQALNDFGFTFPPESRTYWTGWSDRSPEVSYPKAGRDHPSTKYMTSHTARNLVYFAKALRELKLPPLPEDIENAADPEKALARARIMHDQA